VGSHVESLSIPDRGNLKVRRGDWTIAQAHYYYRMLEPSSSNAQAEVERVLEKWCSRFKLKNSDEDLREYEEGMRAYDTARAEFLADRKGRFKAMHESKPIHMHRMDDDFGTHSRADASQDTFSPKQPTVKLS
jgi:hypothetical protein